MRVPRLDTHLYLTLMMMLSSFSSVSALLSSSPNSSRCELRAHFDLNRMHKDGDVVLGGVFPVHRPVYPQSDFTSRPRQPTCRGFETKWFRFVQAMAFAVAEVNADRALLPGVTLGYSLYDSCPVFGASRAALALVGREKNFTTTQQRSCAAGSPPVLGLVGAAGSTGSISISRILGLYRVPQISFAATCSCLSDRTQFPSFFRTVPSDDFRVRAVLQVVKRFAWTWMGLLFMDNDAGRDTARAFRADLARSGLGCLAYDLPLPYELERYDPARLRGIVAAMRESTARVVVVFAYAFSMINLMEEVVRQNVSGLQWVASEWWTTSPVLQRPAFMPYLRGTLSLAFHHGDIPGFRAYLSQTHPDNHTDHRNQNNMVRQFWEHTFRCKFAPLPPEWVDNGGRVCTGQEDLATADTTLLDMSDLRVEYSVYKAAYALAHALHDMLQCVPGRGPFPGHSCATLPTVQPWQLLYYLEKVNFTTSFGEGVSFDEKGDPPPIYDVVSWAWLPGGSAELNYVGVVKRTASGGHEELILDEEDRIYWNSESKKPPRSVCSESCSPGTRLARRKGEPVCCFDCIACSEGEISNETDSTECFICPEDFWSNAQHDHCVPKAMEFLSYHEALGISLTTMSLLGTLTCATVLGIFVYHRNTPMVRANNSELSFQLLMSLKLCFLCSLLFIGRPRLWTCQLRHAAFGISFVLCVSCILVKTMVVLAVFKASKPGGADIMKWFGPMQQRGTVLVLTSIQAIICIAWLVSASPTPHKNTQYHSDKIVYECAVGSIVGFGVLLGYIGLLALLSFLLAFMARNLPDNFNEAKLITFSMLIFCAVWIAFIPAYISSPGKYADVVEIFAILASSFGILVALFGPKCYIIVLRPERNTKKSIMGRGAPKT